MSAVTCRSPLANRSQPSVTRWRVGRRRGAGRRLRRAWTGHPSIAARRRPRPVGGEELPSTLERFLLGDIAWWRAHDSTLYSTLFGGRQYARAGSASADGGASDAFETPGPVVRSRGGRASVPPQARGSLNEVR